MTNLKIQIDPIDAEFSVFIELTNEQIFEASLRMKSVGFSMWDHFPETVCYEHQGGRFAYIDLGNTKFGNGIHLLTHLTLEGDDRLDGTKVPSTLNLDDQLWVAKIMKGLLA